MKATQGHAQAQLVQSVLQKLGRIGGVLEQLGLGAELDQKGLILLTQDFREGITAFVEKRTPVWKGK